MYGYLRGANLKPGARAHLAGVGDFSVSCSRSPPRIIRALVFSATGAAEQLERPNQPHQSCAAVDPLTSVPAAG